MLIDQSRYEAFWQNPERYRQIYELNRVGKVLPYGLMRGIAFHTIADSGPDDALWVSEVLSGRLPDKTGRILILSRDAIANAWAMWRVYLERGISFTQLASELEFEFPIEGSPHAGIGRLDKIVRRAHDDALWVLEFKTAYARANYDKELDRWFGQKQADFEILGAKALGYDVEGVLVQYVIETVPPKVWMPMEVKRTDHQLAVSKLNIHQTGEIIEMLRATFGIDKPWPHLYNWPCGAPGKCEYETVCCRAEAEVGQDDLATFKLREEHLRLLQ